MDLTYTKTEYMVVNDADMDEFINAEYDLLNQFNTAYSEEISDGTCKIYNVKKKALTSFDIRSIELFRESRGRDNREFILLDLLTDLCNRDRIKPGKYLVDYS